MHVPESQMSSIRLLKTFIAVAEEGSFTAAAARVALSQSAVSLQMKALEDDLRQPLFSRQGKLVALNDGGRDFFHAAVEIVRIYENAQKHRAVESGFSGVFEIGCISSALSRLVEALVPIRADNPRLVINISTGKSHKLLEQVDRGKLDAALAVGDPARTPPDSVLTRVYGEPLILIAPAGMALGDGAQDPLALLDSDRFIRLARDDHTGQLIDRALHVLKKRPAPYFEFNSIEAIINVVRTGLGCAIVPAMRAYLWHQQKDLQVWPLPEHLERREIVLAQPRIGQGERIISRIRASLAD